MPTLTFAEKMKAAKEAKETPIIDEPENDLPTANDENDEIEKVVNVNRCCVISDDLFSMEIL